MCQSCLDGTKNWDVYVGKCLPQAQESQVIDSTHGLQRSDSKDIGEDNSKERVKILKSGWWEPRDSERRELEGWRRSDTHQV